MNHSSLLDLYEPTRPNPALQEFLSGKGYVLSSLSTRLLFRHDQVKVFFQEGVSHSARFWGQYAIGKNDLFITTLPWFHDQAMFSSIAGVIRATQPLGGDALDQFLLCCNASSEVVDARKAGFKRAFLIHHNAFLDSNLYQILENPLREKRYFLVVNCRPESWKRPYFAKDIKNLAIIKGANYRPDEYFELKDLSPAFINESRLPPNQVVEVLNQSFCGGVFSEAEGGNYSSGEYLLCGLPVVSTPSKGGRDEYFNEDNHELVYEPSDVVGAVTRLVNRQLSDPNFAIAVRQGMLRTSSRFLRTLFDQASFFLNQAGLTGIDFETIYKSVYKNKMTEYTAAR